MKKADIEHYRGQLAARRDDLHAQSALALEARAPVSLDQQSVGRVSRVDAMQQQAMSLAQEQQRAHEIIRINQALRRIDEGEFGYCDTCGEEIAEGRLKVDPSVRFCVRCAQ